ncbi:MAG: response regulator transcription factor [Chitinophagaceae bacterium]|nr:response regulator transcription factor [Chitinophagaceae bacterium]
MQPRILIADDHSMVRKGLKASFKFEMGYTDVAEVSSCNGLMKALRQEAYTHLVLDINLSDGSSLEVLPNIKHLYPDLRIAVLSMQPTSIYAKVLQQYGALYFINKVALEEDTTRLLRRFLSNEPPPRELSKDNTTNPFSNFTARELEVLHYLLKGLKTNEIASKLGLMKSTISTVKARIFEKTGTKNLLELTTMAIFSNINVE